MYKEEAESYFQVPSKHLCEKNVDNHDRYHSWELMHQFIFKPESS